MGEIAEMMLDGTLCQYCGEYIGDDCGYPRSCGCYVEKEPIEGYPEQNWKPKPHCKCPECGKRVKVVGLADHRRDVHQIKE